MANVYLCDCVCGDLSEFVVKLPRSLKEGSQGQAAVVLLSLWCVCVQQELCPRGLNGGGLRDCWDSLRPEHMIVDLERF